MRKICLTILCTLCISIIFAQTITFPGGSPNFCPGGQTVLTASNPPTGTIQWRFATNYTGPYSNIGTGLPTLNVSTVGFYTVFVSGSPITRYDTIQVALHPLPTASFTSNPTGQCGTTRVNFNNTSTGGATYSWNFGDPNSGANNTSTAINPTHRFVGIPGNVTQNFTVSLTTTSANGCVATTTRSVTTTQLPDATLGGPGFGIYDNKKFFKKCNSASSDIFDFFNSSTTQATNTNYQIIWGDGTADYNSPTFPPPPFTISHTFPVGTTIMKFIVTGLNGCRDTTDYYIFLGTNPSVGLENPGNTSICTGSILTFPITGTASHPPGTTYTVTFNDGTPVLNLPYPAPASITHTFNTTSCGTSSSIYANSFSATLQASNPCASSSAIVVPIYVSQKSSPTFDISANDTVCTTNNVVFTNTTGANSDVSNGSCTPGKLVWKITPATGWTVVTGTLGNNFNSSNTNFWITGTNDLTINFNTPGNYSIKLITGNTTCLTDSITQNICVSAPPIAGFNLSSTEGCAPMIVNTTNTSPAAFCGDNKYIWEVLYVAAPGCLPAVANFIYLNGTNANSSNPQFQFLNPGTYTISLTTISPGNTCTSNVITRTILVKDKPNVTLQAFTAICQGQSINPSATVSCFLTTSSTYAWSFPGGNPATSNLANPGTISYSIPGNYTVSLVVTNECGSTTVTQPLVVNPVPDLTIPANNSLCVGETAGPFTFTSSAAGVTYNWTNNNTSIGLAASGTGNISAFVPINTGSTPLTALINVTASNGLCSSQQSFSITVNPLPLAPIVSSSVEYCKDETPVALAATATAGNSLLWYTIATGGTGSITTPVPLTSTVGVTNFYVSQINNTTNCEGPRSLIAVTIKPVPLIALGTIVNPVTCGSSTGSISLTGLVAGTSYIVNYIRNTTAVTVGITANASGIVTISGLDAATYSNIFVVLNGCPSQSVGPVTLADPTQPATPIVTSNQPLCSGATLNLTANSSTTGASYLWTGPNGFSSSIANPSITNVGVEASGTYLVTATLSGCISVAGSVNVVVNPTPIGNGATNNGPICEGQNITLSGSTVTVGTIGYSWTGPNGFTSVMQNPFINNATLAATGVYTLIVTGTSNGQQCPAPAVSTTVTINPVPVIGLGTVIQPIQCGSSTGSISISGLINNGTYSVNYTVGGSPVTTTLSASASGVITITGLAAGAYSNIFVVLNGCASNALPLVTLADPNPPAVPSLNSNDPLCTGGTLLLSASSSTPGVSYTWAGPNGFVSSLSNPSITNVTVAASGIYTATATLNGCISAAGTRTILINPTPEGNVASNNGPICEGQNVTLSGTTATVGSMSYNWTGPNGFTSTVQNPLITNAGLAATGTYTLVVTATTNGQQCASLPVATNITIKPVPVINISSSSNPTSCGSATGSITLGVLMPNTAYTINYIFNGSAQTQVVTADANGNLNLNNLLQGLYNNISIVLDGCASLPVGPFNLIDPNPPTIPNISSNSAICVGSTLNLLASSTSPGLATYLWLGPNGFNSTLQNPSIPVVDASNAGTYSVTVTINSCTSQPASTTVVINPLASLPLVNSPVSYCINATAVALTATNNAAHTLNWYSSPTGGIALGAAPVPLTTTAGTTAYYVSQTNPLGCEGTRAQIDVIIRPDALASFIPTDTRKCAPFNITAAEVGLQPFSANNSGYNWYANNILIGSGPIFPGYTINVPDDSVTIKLVAVTAFGCRNDSMERKFYSIKVPVPSFTISDPEGCGPLPVNIVNTSAEINLYNYFWDFGNGQTSTLQQPGTILFPTNPTYGDTVYTISLRVASICDTVIFTRQVRVKSPPKALFIPSRTTGCSPMRVLFTNISGGLNNTYYWDLGDGTSFITTARDTFTHVYNTGVVNTFTVQLIAVNDCGADTIRFPLIVAPNNIRLNYAVNGPDNFGCAPHTVAFVNISSGASTFQWNFGDGNSINTTDNIDTVYHTYANAGNYTVSVTAINSCTDTTAIRFITVYPKPIAAFVSNAYTVCIGQPVQLSNQSTAANTYAWNFGDGNTSVLVNPTHTYNNPGLYSIRLIAFRNNPSGDVCIDTAFQQILVRDTLPGFFSMSDSLSNCAPLTVTFVNRVRPSVTATWNFGDGTIGIGDSVIHSYTLPGVYLVNLTVTVPGGCVYLSTDTVTVLGPSGSFVYDAGSICSPNAVMFTANASNANRYVWNFGDGNTLTSTSNVVFYTYPNAGNYVPSVLLQNTAGCSFPLVGIDTIKVDKINAGFIYAAQQNCGSTLLQFTDTSNAFFGINSIRWDFGDGTNGTGRVVNHLYSATGLYTVTKIAIGNSGCADTSIQQINVQVNGVPVASIIADTERCAFQNVVFSANVVSTDPITIQQWRLSNGVTAVGPSFSYLFNIPGTYSLRFISGTDFGCFDTAFHTIVIRPVPVINASNSLTLCLGNTAQLNVTGASNYQWIPAQGLSCTTCPNPVASPTITTPYVVTATNAFGCAAYDTVVVTVIQPMNLVVSPNDSICVGSSSNLLASGATTYIWSPGATLSSTTQANPVATPTITTSYRVVGYDGFNCFTDTAFVVVAVGNFPTVNLGPDLTLSTGTQHPLNSSITNGPIASWLWQPSTDLSCNNCPLPIATIKKDIKYTVMVTSPYGCSATDTILLKTFCESAQVFIPNAFTPDGDGINDVLMVRGKGIVSVKHFRIFNRWGELVFERSNFSPNIVSLGWDGSIKGVVGAPDVFVYTAEVVCENGTTYVYKGNTSIIK